MKRKLLSGFTILELMVTIVVAAVLLAIAVPSYTTMVKNNCLTTKANAIVTAMQLARSTAVTVRDEVSVAASCTQDGNAASCTDSNDEFGDGVLVFRDINGNGFPNTSVSEDANSNGTLDPGEDLNGDGVLNSASEVLRIIEFTCAATIDETSDVLVFSYGTDGAADQSVSMNICDDRNAGEYLGRQLTVGTTGRPGVDSKFQFCP